MGMATEPTERAEEARGRPPADRDAEDGRGPAAGRGRGGLAVLGVLRHREFALFWSGQTISLVGTWMQAFAQGYVVTRLTSSATALGLVNFAMSVPTLLLMPFGGVAADRLERRRILIYTQWAMLVLAAVFGALIALHRLEIWHVYLIALVLGVATAYDLPAYQSFYPQLVEPGELPQAISLNQATFHGSRIIGPAVAAVLVHRWGEAAAFFANGASFLAVIVTLLMIRARPAAAPGRGGSMLTIMREGFQYVRERPEMQALLGITGITTLFIFPNLAVLTPYYARYVLHVGPGGLGTLMSVSGVGALFGAVLLLTVPEPQRVQRISIGMGTILVTLSVLAWSRSLWVSTAAMTCQSFALSHSLGLTSIMVQDEVTDAVRGRVMSLYSLMFTGVMPFGALLIPKLVDLLGMRLELQLAAVLYAGAACLLILRLRHAHRMAA
jgi:MFS family permease